MIPLWFFNVHKLHDNHALSCLKSIEKYKLCKYISDELYNEWLGANSDKYQLGINDELLHLWDDRLNNDSIDLDKINNYIKLGLEIRKRDENSRNNLVDTFTYFDGTDVRYPGMSLRRCKKGGYHIRISKMSTRKYYKILNIIFPWQSHEDKQKTNIDLASLVFYAVTNDELIRVNELFSVISVGVFNSMAVGLLIMALGNKHWPLVRDLIRKDGYCCMEVSGHKTYFKAISTALRRTSRWVDGSTVDVECVANLAYTELSIGRSCNKIDWLDEHRKRIGPRLPLQNPYTNENYLVVVERVLDKILVELMPRRDEWGSWYDFCRTRQSWAPAGSAGGAKLKIKDETIRLNKHSYFETIKLEEMVQWIDEEPKIAAKGSDKMEAGKARAIYGTLPHDQAITTYVIRPIEKMMQKCPNLIAGHTGAHEIADIGIRLKNVCGDHVECTMLDYADFNYQHTLEAQSLLFVVLGRHVAKFGNTDLNKAVSWVANAQLNQWVQFPEDDTWYRVTQGLFSGVRSTDFTNTLLNLAYYEAAKQILYEHTHLEPLDEFHLHKGDDVWITNKSRLWAAQLYKTMSDANFVFQASKQMFDQNRGEFLRVIYTRDGAIGYVMRSVATFVLKPIQSVEELAPQGRATALTSQIHLLYRRGLNEKACRILWWATVPHALRLKLPGNSGVGIPLSVAGKSFINGGLDLGPPMTKAITQLNTNPVPAPVAYVDDLSSKIPRNMAHDWISVVSERVRTPFDANKLEDTLHDLNVSDSLRTKDRLHTMRHLEKELKLWNQKIIKVEAMRKTKIRESMTLNHVPSIDYAEFYAKKMYDQVDIIVKSGKVVSKRINIVSILTAGVASSPFRDLSSAKMALKLTDIEAAKFCYMLADNVETGRKASNWLECLIKKLGNEVTTCILQGIRGVGPSYESMLHPVVLSWACKCATDYAILDAMQKHILTSHEWYLHLDNWMTDLIIALLRNYNLSDWSHY